MTGGPATGSSSWAAVRLAVQLVRQVAPRHLTAVIVLQVLAAIAVGLGLRQLQVLLDAVTVEPPRLELSDLVDDLLLLGLAGVAAGVSSLLIRELRPLIGEMTIHAARQRIVQAAIASPYAAYDDPVFHDRLVRAQRGATARTWDLVRGLTGLGSAALPLVAVAVVLVTIDPLAVGVAVLAVVPVALAAAANSGLLHGFEYGLTPADRERGYLFGLLTRRDALPEVRALGLDRHLSDRHDVIAAERVEARRALVRRRILRLMPAVVVGVVGSTIAVAVIVRLVVDGDITVADAGVAVVALQQVGVRLRSLSESVVELRESALFVSDLLDFVAPTVVDGPAADDAPALRLVELDGVDFTYTGRDRPALADVSIRIEQGETVALVGRNGSGKSTVVKLLLGLYEPDAGAVRWNGQPLGDDNIRGVRRRIAPFLQEPLRYVYDAGTNVGFGEIDRRDDESAIDVALDVAGLTNVVDDLPDGRATMLSTEFGGVDLSSGQWRRLAFARSMFRRGDLVVLDEPSTALDPEAEGRLVDVIEAGLADRTALVVSHRWSTVRLADRIYVLDEGRVVEEGSHTDLVARGGLYASLFEAQAGQFR